MDLPSHEQLPNNDLPHRVKKELTRNSLLKDEDLTVTAEGDTIVLQGIVDSLDKKWLAEDIALDTFGVLHVQNEIEVNGSYHDHTRRTQGEIRYGIDTGLS